MTDVLRRVFTSLLLRSANKAPDYLENLKHVIYISELHPQFLHLFCTGDKFAHKRVHFTTCSRLNSTSID